MAENRRLPARLVILLVAATLAVSAAAAMPGVEFAEPAEGSVLVGPTTFTLQVTDSRVERADLHVDGVLIGSVTAPDWSLVWEAPQLSDVEVHAVCYGEKDVLGVTKLQTAMVEFGEAIRVTTVPLYPIVRDFLGRYVRDLERKDFAVLEGGQPAAIEHFAVEVTDLSLALLIDTSGSMQGRLDIVQNAILQLLRTLHSGDLVSVYGFSARPQRQLEWTTERAPAASAVLSLSAGGGTALYDAVTTVSNDVCRDPGRKVVLLFSDGIDQDSFATLAKAVDAAVACDVKVYAVGAVVKGRDDLDRDDLERLADATGGEAFFFKKIKEVPKFFQSIAKDLRAQYSIAFRPRDGTRAETRQIEIEVKGGKYRVRHRESFRYQPD